MGYLAWRNLTQSKTRFLLSVGGVTLALALVLVLDAILAGFEGPLAAPIERSSADVWVSQKGVRNLHMVLSTLPEGVVEEVAEVPGVASVTPMLYTTQMLRGPRGSRSSYIFGLPADAQAGKPAGAWPPGAGEVILDSGLGQALGLEAGDSVRVFGRNFRVAGFATGLSNPLIGVSFLRLEDFARLRRSRDAVSFVLVRVGPGRSAEEVARRIEEEVEGVSALSRAAFARQERAVVRDMGADAVNIMNLAGLLIGLAVMALVMYTATLSRRAEYGVLKALGTSSGHLYRVALAQALYSVGLGLGLAVALTLVLSLVLSALGPNLPLQLTWASLLKAGGMALVIAGVASALPIRQIARLDPARVYRGGAR